jgi:hypothetical protein
MKRVALVLVCLAACATPRAERAERADTGPAPPRLPAHDEADVAPLRIDPARIVDTSIGAIWHREAIPEPPPPRAPVVEEPEPDVVARAMPRARTPGRRAPCFAHRDVLVASEIWRDLQAFSLSMSSDPPPSGRYGTCTIANGELRDVRGTLIAELHCGVTAHVPGIIDERGFEVGASTTEIAAEFPTGDAICRGEVEGRARCWFFSRDDNSGSSEWTQSHYTIAAPIAGDEPLRGDVARAHFKARTVVALTARMSCH